MTRVGDLDLPWDPTAVVLFSGAGGLSLGLERAGVDVILALDNDPIACQSHGILCRRPGHVADLLRMTPDELADLCPIRPDILATSPPCKGFSGCLPKQRTKEGKYIDLCSLAQRGIWVSLEAWADQPPPFILLENVPRIRSRGAEWLRQIVQLLHAYGYAVDETVHNCGELGGLSQSRRRYLLVARHMAQVRKYLYKPPKKRLRPLWDAVSRLPTPLPNTIAAGPMHRLPRLSPLNWLRLASIPPGKDWRSLPDAVKLPPRAARQNGGFGVEDPREPAHSVLAEGTVRNTRASIADPRIQKRDLGNGYVRTGVTCVRRDGSLGVQSVDSPSPTIIGHLSIHNYPGALADVRMVPATHELKRGVLQGPPLDFDSKRPVYVAIRAEDGSWHRPFTTLELAAIQGFPTEVDGVPLVLAGKSHGLWRQHIGNAVPPPTAQTIGTQILRALSVGRADRETATDGVWVRAPGEYLHGSNTTNSQRHRKRHERGHSFGAEAVQST